LATQNSKLVSCLRKRDLLNDPNGDENRLIREGERFLEEGFLMDALNCFSRARHTEGLEAVWSAAVESGDTFVCIAAGQILGRTAPEVWRHVGEKALEAGKLFFARSAFEKAGDLRQVEEMTKRIQEGGFGKG